MRGGEDGKKEGVSPASGEGGSPLPEREGSPPRSGRRQCWRHRPLPAARATTHRVALPLDDLYAGGLRDDVDLLHHLHPRPDLQLFALVPDHQPHVPRPVDVRRLDACRRRLPEGGAAGRPARSARLAGLRRACGALCVARRGWRRWRWWPSPPGGGSGQRAAGSCRGGGGAGAGAALLLRPFLQGSREAGSLLSSRARGGEGREGARGGYLEPGDAVVPGGEPGLAPPAAGPVAVRLVPVHHGRPRGGGGGPGLPLFTTNKHTQTRHHLPKTAWPPGRPMVRHRHGAGGHLADGQPGPGRERSGSGRPTGRGAPDGPTSELERLKCAEWHALATFITTERPPATPPGRSRVKMVAAPAGPHP